VKYLDFVVQPGSPSLKNGVVDVELELSNDLVFFRACKPGDVFKISTEDLLECQDALHKFVAEGAVNTTRYFQDGQYPKDPPGCIDFMSFVMTRTQASAQKAGAQAAGSQNPDGQNVRVQK
jgi:hypothetical protein